MTDSGVIPPPQDRARCKTCLDEEYIEVEPDGDGLVFTVPCPDCQLAPGEVPF